MLQVDIDYKVHIYMTARATSQVFFTCDSVEEAIELCQLYNWHYVDENGFDWNLEID